MWLYIGVHQDNPGFGTFTWRLISMPHAHALALASCSCSGACPIFIPCLVQQTTVLFSLMLITASPPSNVCGCILLHSAVLFDVTEQTDYDDRTCIPSDLNRTQISAVMIALREFCKNLVGKPLQILSKRTAFNRLKYGTLSLRVPSLWLPVTLSLTFHPLTCLFFRSDNLFTC